jgi:hypothetical protein
MQSACRQSSTLIALLVLLTGPAAASSVVFEKVDLFKGKTVFTDTFQVDSAGNYEATLTDFEFPRPLKRMALNITTAKDTLGSLFAPGSFEFEADPGTYYVSFFALAGQGNKRDKDREHGKERDREKRKDRHEGSRHQQGKSAKPKQKQNQKREHGDWMRGHDMMNLGQYGIEIAYLDGMDNGMPPYEHPGNGNAVVPVPAAAWLFLSGLLGISGIGFRRRLRR